MKAHTDFNDLAARSEYGREGVFRQVVSAAPKVKERHEQRHVQQGQGAGAHECEAT
jgi:putative DNA primase/helicase